MIKIETSVTINRPVEDVWKFISNWENFAQWDRGVLEVRQTSEGPTAVGSTLQSVRLILGLRGIGALRVTEYEPNKLLAVKGSAASVSGSIRFTFEPIGDGTQLTETREVELGGLWKLIAPIILPMQETQGRNDLANVKRVLESPPQAEANHHNKLMSKVE